MSSDIIPNEESFRQCLSAVVASLCLEANYESAEESVLKTLTEMMQNYIIEVGKGVRLFYEHSGRTLPNGRDVMCALAEMGFPSHQLPEYLSRTRRINLGQISKSGEASNAPVLQVGKRKNFPNYVPEHFNFPPFPDPHSYVRTTTGEKESTDYVILRERLSEQRRDVEKALTRFVAKTGKSHPLLPHDKNAFPLIASEVTGLPYILALLPSEHEVRSCLIENGAEDELKENPSDKTSGGDDMALSEQIGKRRNDDEQSGSIRNPFLRPVKKLKTKKKS